MKLFSILLLIGITIVAGVLAICAMILSSWLDESGLRYHLYDEEGENNGQIDTRKSNRISKSVSEAKRVRKK